MKTNKKRNVLETMRTFKKRRGIAIPLAVLSLFIFLVFLVNVVSFTRNQDYKAFHVANVEKAKNIAESAISLMS
jgi:hypothetical protein